MAFQWYKIFNSVEFEALGLPSKTYTQNLEGIGETDVLVTKGDEIGVLFQDVFLVVGLNGKNPFVFEERAVYKNSDDDVFVGIQIEDENES